jgi:hypothetical protein
MVTKIFNLEDRIRGGRRSNLRETMLWRFGT